MNLAIIQARMNSSRLPGKVLAEIAGKKLIEHVIERVRSSELVDEVVVATTNQATDDELAKFIENNSLCRVFRGSENDVLERFYKCASAFNPQYIVRVTADDPLKDPRIIDRAINIMLHNSNLQYCSNTLAPTFPEGLDIEVFTYSCLDIAYKEAKLSSEREHVTPYIWKHTERFITENFEHSENLSGWRWTVDNYSDLKFVRKIFDIFYNEGEVFSYIEVIEYLKKYPDLLEINSGVVRNEGYLKSINEEIS